MEGKAEKLKEKRLSKNSKELRADETDLERALRKSQKEERRAARRKAKEDKEIESILEISRLEAERQQCELDARTSIGFCFLFRSQTRCLGGSGSIKDRHRTENLSLHWCC
jgi:hypothetical protein